MHASKTQIFLKNKKTGETRQILVDYGGVFLKDANEVIVREINFNINFKKEKNNEY